MIMHWSCDQTSPERISSSKCSTPTIWPINGRYFWKESNLWMVFQPQHMVGSWETILWVRERRNTKGWVHTAQHNGLLEFPPLTRTLPEWRSFGIYCHENCQNNTSVGAALSAQHPTSNPGLYNNPLCDYWKCVCVFGVLCGRWSKGRGLVVSRNWVHSFTFTCDFPLSSGGLVWERCVLRSSWAVSSGC